MRTFNDDEGRAWEAMAIPTKVAHLRDGARLGFRAGGADADAAPYATTIEFNSMDAAAFAIGTMSEKELRRRLDLARTAAGA